MEINIPIYRAERIDGKGFVKGFLIKKTYDNNKVRYFLLEDKHKEVAMTYEIKIETLAIHFEGMLDSNGTRIFASLESIGGDILTDGVYEFSVWFETSQFRLLGGDVNSIFNSDWENWSDFTIKGIQQ